MKQSCRRPEPSTCVGGGERTRGVKEQLVEYFTWAGRDGKNSKGHFWKRIFLLVATGERRQVLASWAVAVREWEWRARINEMEAWRN